MQSGWEFLWTVIASSAGTTALLALAGWMFKAKISHWLNKDIEDIKARHKRDLESYKTMLIAQAEAVKASQDVKKSMALNIANMRFESVRKLHESTAGAGVVLASYVRHCHTLSLDSQVEKLDDFVAQGEAMQRAILQAAPFVGSTDTCTLLNLHTAFFEEILALAKRGGQAMPDEAASQFISKMFALQTSADRVVHKHFGEMFHMA
ncbi:hypothetical protein SDC9_83795 [bioreactor metagenome]|uniref:Uncharacterized protein n=1 Tax=bioreactor metagenome TaxID=1076179 RepID=A0A644Z952_9ZZZZ